MPYNGEERQHDGRYDLLPFIPSAMEWVITSGGRVPIGRRPIEGGYEEDGSQLYHAAARIGNITVPGKTGPHLVRIIVLGFSIWVSLLDINIQGGARVAFGNREHCVKDNYEIL